MIRAETPANGEHFCPGVVSVVRSDTMWENRRGDRIDPVPFIVTVLLSFMVVFSFGPIYAMEYGFAQLEALAISSVIMVAIGAGAYYRLVWTYRPEMREEVPVESRLQRLFYAIIAGVLVLGALTYPIVAG
ncbi:MAG: hypothetical protein ABEI31_05920 [Halodesulfurarchaeum sp.]